MPTTAYDIFRVALDGSGMVEPLLQTPFQETNARVSANGRWLAYDSNVSGRYEIYVRPFPDVQAGQWQVSTEGGEEPVWARDGSRLYYRALDGAVMAVGITSGPAWSAGRPAQMVRPGYYTGENGGPNNRGGLINPTYDVARDGRFLMIKEEGSSSTRSLVVVQNWHSGLTARERR